MKLLIPFLLLLSACSIDTETILQDQHGLEQAQQVVINNDDSWTALWASLRTGTDKPAIDFEKDMMLGVFMGQRNTGGYSTTIMSVKKSGDVLEVTYTESSPAPGEAVTQALTAPFHLVKISKSDRDVIFTKAS